MLNANFIHFYQLHPDPSPRPGKCCHLKKRRKIALCRRYFKKVGYNHTLSYFFILSRISWSLPRKNRCPKNGTHTRVLDIVRFLVNTRSLIYFFNLLPYSYRCTAFTFQIIITILLLLVTIL